MNRSLYLLNFLMMLLSSSVAFNFMLKIKNNDYFKSAENKWGSVFNSTGTLSRKTASTDSDHLFYRKFDSENKEAMDILNSLLDSKSGWSNVGGKDGVDVDRRFLSAGNFVSKEDAEKGGKHACIKSSAIIDATPESVFELFFDGEKAKEFNEHITNTKDVKFINYKKNAKTWSKITYSNGPSYGPFKARDFLSVVHFIKEKDGSYVILNRPAYLNAYKPNNKFVRATVLLAGNVIKPYGNKKTRLTLLAQVNPGGISDTKAAAWIINKLCAAGPPTFIRKLEKVAQKLDKQKSKNNKDSRFDFTFDHSVGSAGKAVSVWQHRLSAISKKLN